ncbi:MULTISPECIES: TldD/PmbA family protein [Methanosarcina]|uniref:TldE protein, part of TldE/TldD proteolytic complex n=1 Tax=Methanosarcina vacuolata Z-761 TaxID=1434123 RepID=A0A0E3Q512_9EURY|nr:MULTISPECIES: TldD/PmbA family protein [Methanosarcina]AKB44564.1 TldE protein, part of TldE/TldD proteolytic complex [Methanosarcina vacuolata Z-761]AKB48077.1 TldE protein, part of TldE/TldD proteolytic complex [Methanosarcina sp. Kolksee]
MYELARKALRLAEKAGAEEAEIYYAANHSTGVNFRKDALENAKDRFSEGIGIRAIVNGAVGFASTNSAAQIEDAVEVAVAEARVRESDPDWVSLPSNGKYPTVSGIFDKKVETLELESCIEYALALIEGTKEVPGTLPTSGGFTRSKGKQLILNTNGIEIEEESTAVSGFVDVITVNGQASTAYDFGISRSLDIDFFSIGKNAADLALKSNSGIKIEPQKTDVIFHPFAISDIIEEALAPSLDADNVQKGRSGLIDKVGEELAVPELSIYDDGLIEAGIETSASDDEGVPSQRTTVIGKGVLETYLYDSYTAGKAGVRSTGNSSRSSYTSPPSVGLRNVILDYPQTDVIADTQSGVFVNTVIGAHTANSISGDFSVEARNAFTIKDGALDKPIKSLMISGNAFELLKQISGAGFDVRKVGGIITPSIRVSDMSVIG